VKTKNSFVHAKQTLNMIDLSTNYMGLSLRSPVIVGSSGLTRNIENLEEIERRGAGAVVLKSLFEEQIKVDIRKVFSYEDVQSAYTEADDYIRNYARTHTLNEYLTLIHEAKKRLSIPVIASINCVSGNEWPAFAKDIQAAGADALELNVFLLPADVEEDGRAVEETYFEIIENVKKLITIPIALKISYHFSGLAEMIKRLSWTGIKGLVLFNRFFSPDINIDTFRMSASNLYSRPEEITTSLRWIAILSGKVQCDLCASTGVHDGKGVIKQILAGAHAVQVCSILYKNGFSHLDFIHNEIRAWMQKKQFFSIEQFRAKMSHKKSDSPAIYHRVQFMKHFAGID
jgi:dihydroorotate dehydrogenase (fumarate)